MKWYYVWLIRLYRTFENGRLFARLIASWLASATLILLASGTASFTRLSFAQGIGFAHPFLVALVIFIVLTVFAMLWQNIHVDSWALLLFLTVCTVLWCLKFDGQTNKVLFALGAGIVYAMVLLYFLRANRPLLEKPEMKTPIVWIVAGAAGVIACGVIAAIGCLRYLTFSAPNFDFGIFCNAFYNMTQSGLPITGCERDTLLSHFAVHMSPVFYLLLPFYWLFPSPMTLQIAQALLLAAGVIPVVLLARHHKLSGKVTAVLASLYAFYPALSTGCFYDFHENCFLPLFLLLTFLFYEKKKYIPMYVSAICVLSVKEDAAIYLLIFALYVLISERAYLHGAILAALAVGYFLLCTYWLKNYGEGVMSNRFDNLIYHQSDGLLGAIKTLLLNPGYALDQLFTVKQGSGFEKIVYVLQMLLPLGFLPLCTKKPSRWLLIVPMLINLLTQYPYQYDIGFQYHFGITAFLFYAAIKNLPDMEGESRQNLLAIAASACLCLYMITVVPSCARYSATWRENRETYQEIEAVLDTVPQDASVSVSTFFLPHIADREVIYETYYHDYATDVDYVVLDLRSVKNTVTQEYYMMRGYEVVTIREELIVVLRRSEPIS